MASSAPRNSRRWAARPSLISAGSTTSRTLKSDELGWPSITKAAWLPPRKFGPPLRVTEGMDT
jgi:hypothetical protein